MAAAQDDLVIARYEYIRYEDPADAFRPYDPRCPEVARRVIDLIARRLPEARVEHVGSTAIPGCDGKGVVDLMLLYPPGRLAAARDALDGLGFQRQRPRPGAFTEERPVRLGTVEHDGETFRLHVHIIAADSAEATEQVRFRERLRADPALVAEYVARKRSVLAGGVQDSTGYNLGKESFIHRVLGRPASTTADRSPRPGGTMPFNEQRRAAILRERAADYVRVALDGITREYPHMPYFIASGPESYRTHRQLHPAFYGCFDWHSCVEMHWAVVRLLRQFPEAVPAAEARATLDESLTEEHVAAEAAFFADQNHRTLERPYGWGWLLTLAHELATWDDPDGRRWLSALRPLADLLAKNLAAWLPRLTYPQRSGVHPNTAFALSRSYDYATDRADGGLLLDAIHEAAVRWFRADTDYPAHYEPSGADFLSAALAEAELMSRILPAAEFPGWLERFLPGLAEGRPAALFRPAVVSDVTDGQIAHLHGLNLSRAWAFAALAARLPADDARIAPLLAAAERHAHASLPFVAGSDYMVEHWLAAYATLLLS